MFSFILYYVTSSTIKRVSRIYQATSTNAKLLIKLITICLGTLLLSSCTPSLLVDMSAGSLLNPDSHRHSLPVQVKLFELNDNTAFMTASFHELWQHERSVLGRASLFSKNLTVTPKSQMMLRLPRYNNAKYFAVMAIYRIPIANNWRKIVKIPHHTASSWEKIIINLSQYKVTINK